MSNLEDAAQSRTIKLGHTGRPVRTAQCRQEKRKNVLVCNKREKIVKIECCGCHMHYSRLPFHPLPLPCLLEYFISHYTHMYPSYFPCLDGACIHTCMFGSIDVISVCVCVNGSGYLLVRQHSTTVCAGAHQQHDPLSEGEVRGCVAMLVCQQGNLRVNQPTGRH